MFEQAQRAPISISDLQTLETLVKAEEHADEGRGLIIVVGRGLHTPLGQAADVQV